MNESLDEFKKRTGDARAAREAAHRPQIEMLAQAQVKTEMLTGDARWDWFLSFLQAVVEQSEAQRDAFMVQCADLRAEAERAGAKVFFTDEAHFRADGDLRRKWMQKGMPALVDSTSPRWGEQAS